MIYFLYHEVPQKKAYEFQPLASSGTHYLNIDKLMSELTPTCPFVYFWKICPQLWCLSVNLWKICLHFWYLSVSFWNFCEFITIFFKAISIYWKSLSRSCINCSVIVWKKSIVWKSKLVWFGSTHILNQY